MEDRRIESYYIAKRARELAEKWNNLPNSNSRDEHENNNFSISVDGCVPPILVRIGQLYMGGKNYWETETEFGQAILEYIVSTWDTHFPKILDILKKKESDKLKECQSYIDEMQQKILEVSR